MLQVQDRQHNRYFQRCVKIHHLHVLQNTMHCIFPIVDFFVLLQNGSMCTRTLYGHISLCSGVIAVHPI
uniref:Uncharacterized protein n=1 Tax=Arundo donax TaxID=35708 RepID=A0A0A9H568_ARUDO